jgi:hypothetical protein
MIGGHKKVPEEVDNANDEEEANNGLSDIADISFRIFNLLTVFEEGIADHRPIELNS